jgi:hypothetical protein
MDAMDAKGSSPPFSTTILMNTKFFLLPLFCLGLGFLLSGCVQDRCEEDITYVQMQPVYRSMAELREMIGSESPRPLRDPGKLYLMGRYVFIAEVNEGIHVIDNLDPRNPQNIAFIRVPGVRDMAVKGSIMYVDSYTDLVSLDIRDPQNVTEVDRDADVFPYGSWHDGLWADPDSGIAIHFDKVEITETIDCGETSAMLLDGGNSGFAQQNVRLFTTDLDAAVTQNEAGARGGEHANGLGGSMARFTLVRDHLYVVTNTDLQAYSVASVANPGFRSTQAIGWGDIETIFPMNDHLLIGSMNGMYVYALENPDQPTYTSEMQHMRSCDPVVAQGEYAYVTLRGGTTCGSTLNQLDVVNISDIDNPWLVASYPMHNPHGLGIRDGVLFICDGDEGLKVYDASDVMAIDENQLAHFADIHAFDVIPVPQILLMVGEDGFYQYDYSDLSDIRLLSTIEVQ